MAGGTYPGCLHHPIAKEIFKVNEIQLFQKQEAQEDLVSSLLCVLSSLQDQLLFPSLRICCRVKPNAEVWRVCVCFRESMQPL